MTTNSKLVFHRGLHSTFINKTLPIENTLQAFELAIKSGAKYIECDIRTSLDNELIVWHDYTFDKYSNCKKAKKPISELKWKQIKKIKLFDKQNPCRLLDVIDLIINTNTKLILDIKCLNATIELALLLNRIPHYKRFIERVIFFSIKYLKHFYERLNIKNIKTCWILTSHYYPPEKMEEDETLIMYDNLDDWFKSHFHNYNIIFRQYDIGFYIQYNNLINEELIKDIKYFMTKYNFKSRTLGLWNDINIYPRFEDKENNYEKLLEYCNYFDYVNIDNI